MKRIDSTKIQELRTAWAHELLYLNRLPAIAEIKQMMIDAMDAVEQTGTDAALEAALETFERKLNPHGRVYDRRTQL